MMKRIYVTILLAFFILTSYGQIVHTVKQDETFESIASFYQIKVDDLKKENESADVLFPGLLLNIPQKTEVPTPPKTEQVSAPKQDKIEMRDGSYIVCKVVSIKKTTILLKQEEIEGNISIPIKDVIEIFYANGNRKKIGKR